MSSSVTFCQTFAAVGLYEISVFYIQAYMAIPILDAQSAFQLT